MTVYINLYADYSADIAHKAISSDELQHFPPSSTPRLLPLRDGESRKNSTIWTCGKLREKRKGQKTPGKTSPRGRERAFGSLLLSAWIKKRWSLELRHWRAPTSTWDPAKRLDCCPAGAADTPLSETCHPAPRPHCFLKIHSLAGFYLWIYLFCCFISGFGGNGIAIAHPLQSATSPAILHGETLLLFYLESVNIYT